MGMNIQRSRRRRSDVAPRGAPSTGLRKGRTSSHLSAKDDRGRIVANKLLLAALVLAAIVGPVASQTYRCFEFNESAVLKNAIIDYVNTAPPKPLTPTSARNVYGPVIGDWCVDRLQSFQNAFQSRTTFNENLTNWNTSSATNMQQMFQDAHSFNQPLGHFDVSRVTNMNRMFRATVSFTGVGLPSWNVGRVESMFNIFYRSKMNQDISGWDVRRVTDLQEAFLNNSNFNQNLCAWGPRLNATKLPATSAKLSNVFLNSGCPVQTNVSLATNPRGPFCWECVAQPPSKAPTKAPTKAPVTMAPTKAPTKAPTPKPTRFPSPAPTRMPTKHPTKIPTSMPVTSAPIKNPTRPPTKSPTKPPTKVPTHMPTSMPVTKAPTVRPTRFPTRPPSKAPTGKPVTMAPTMGPTRTPTRPPTTVPTTKAPTKAPANQPVVVPTKSPTKAPTPAPVVAPTSQPTATFRDAWFDVNENQNYIGREEASFVQAGNKFFYMGGRQDPKRVDRFDYASNTWSTGAPAPKEFNHFQGVTYQGLIWVIGAFNTNNYPNEANEPNVWVFDPAVNTWMMGPAIPPTRLRGGAGVAVYNDQFYVVGGNNGGHNGTAGSGGGPVAFLDRYDPRANTWEALADAPNARDHFNAIAVNSTNKLYCIGGRFTDWPNVFDNTTAMVDVYDFATGTWATLPNVNLPSPRAGAANVLFRGKILVIGGESGTQAAAFKTVSAFDPITQTFSAAANLIYARHGTQALVSGPGVIITGGAPTRGGGYMTNMEVYNQYAPVGTASTAGVLSVAGGTVSVPFGQVTSLSIQHSAGNTGVIVQSLALQGPDVGLFSLLSPPNAPFLVGQGESRTLFAMYNGNKALSTITLVVSYSSGTILNVPLQGVNSNPLPTIAPTKQPTLMPSPARPTTAPTPVSRFGTTCFPADGNALRTAVGTYLTSVQNLTTIAEKLNHSLSITYGYPIGYWCVSKVTNMNSVFKLKATFNEPLTFWNTSSATNFAFLFNGATAFDQDLSNFDTSRVTDMNHVFKLASNFTGRGLEKWDTARVTNMWNMFQVAGKFNGNISGWNTGRVINMKTMFNTASKFNQDISSWNVSLVVDATQMFAYAASFNQSLCAWGGKLTNTTLVSGMFQASSCPLQDIAVSFAYSPPGPFCYDCCCRPALPSAVDGPFEVPLVPAAAGNMHGNLIVGWSARSRYRYGGSGGGTYTTLFDPATQASTLRKVDETGHDMFCPGTSILPDGRFLVSGGQTNAVTSIYNPVTDTWTKGQRLNVGRGYQSQVTLANGRVFTFGGSWNGGIGGKIGEVYTEFPNGTAFWTPLPGITTIPTCLTNDTQGLYRSDNHMWFFEHTDGRILQAGPSRQMHWITLQDNGTITPTVFRGDDSDAMVGGAVYYDLDMVFTVGGALNYDSGAASNRAYIINMTGPEPIVERQPNMIWPRAFINTIVLPNGWIVCAGGQMTVKLFADDQGVLPVEIFDPVAKRFYELRTPLKIRRNYHSVGLLTKDARVLIGGGGLCGIQCDYGTAGNHPDFEILTPPYLLNPTGGPATRPVIQSVSNPSTFSPNGTIQITVDTSENHTFSLIRTGISTHSTNLDQRRVPLTWVQQAGSTFTVRVPASPVHVPPGIYWLFAMNAAGVPSVGYGLTRTFP